MTELTIPPNPADDRPDWPTHWTQEARDAVDNLLDVAELDGAAFNLAVSVGELLTSAGRLEEIAREAKYEAVGSAGQTILHPAVPEARQARSAANATLVRLLPGPELDAKDRSNLGRAMARKRWAR